MGSEDILPTILLIGIIYAIFRYFSKSSQSTSDPNIIRGVTRQMVDAVHAAFPDIPTPNIIYSLSRTRSVQATSEDILERGFLTAPPPSFSIPASLLPEQPATTPTPINTKSALPPKSQTLIERFNLSEKLPSRKGKEKDPAETPASNAEEEGVSVSVEQKNEWAATKEKREQELRQRKERMILEARKRMLEKQAKEQEKLANA